MISKFKQMYIIKIIEMIKEIPMSIFIVGTTGVGKTKLSLELGKKFRGEVVNCDSKQLYKHANIMTAKPTF
jgi:tRNA A37 N6-isopentenylltransferase MiaA